MKTYRLFKRDHSTGKRNYYAGEWTSRDEAIKAVADLVHRKIGYLEQDIMSGYIEFDINE